jgi:hypothetical protein
MQNGKLRHSGAMERLERPLHFFQVETSFEAHQSAGLGFVSSDLTNTWRPQQRTRAVEQSPNGYVRTGEIA